MYKWQICYTEMTKVLQFKINVLKSHRQRQRTLKLVCEDRVLFVWVGLQESSCGQQHPNGERAIRLVYPPLFCKPSLFIQTHKQRSNKDRFGDSNSLISVTLPNQAYVHTNLFFQRWSITPPKCWSFLLNHPVYTNHAKWKRFLSNKHSFTNSCNIIKYNLT